MLVGPSIDICELPPLLQAQLILHHTSAQLHGRADIKHYAVMGRHGRFSQFQIATRCPAVASAGLFNTLYYTVAFVVWFNIANVPSGETAGGRYIGAMHGALLQDQAVSSVCCMCTSSYTDHQSCSIVQNTETCQGERGD